MRLAFRVLVSALAAMVAFFFASWTLVAVLSFALGRHVAAPVVPLVALLVAAGCGAALARFVWRTTAGGGERVSRSLAMSIVRGAVVVGTLGFVAGFFGPIIFTPKANQGPLLGIFITGPLGVIVGAIGGGVQWSMRRDEVG
jgi:hypothetical protein